MSIKNSLEKSINRILLKRLKAAYALITALIVILVLIFQLYDIREIANEQAV